LIAAIFAADGSGATKCATSGVGLGEAVAAGEAVAVGEANCAIGA
jgi:hypothetical protein